jgi:hypothetical protein
VPDIDNKEEERMLNKQKMGLAISGCIVSAFALSGAASAGPREMMAKCRDRAHQIMRTRLPDIETKYEGQRVDGTHAVNGTAYINDGEETFQCSFDRRGRRIIRFIVNN